MAKKSRRAVRNLVETERTSPTLAQRIQEMAVHMAMMEKVRKKGKKDYSAHICPAQKFKLNITAAEFLAAKEKSKKQKKKKTKNKKTRKANPIVKRRARSRVRKPRKLSRNLAQLMRRYPRIFKRLRKSMRRTRR